ncbi:MAG: hypothetical protein RMX67_07860 [Planktomarina sp.]|nr:hypothetical protein [Planktomarina sp.]
MAQVEVGIFVLPVSLISLMSFNKDPKWELELNSAFQAVMEAVEPEYSEATPDVWAEAAAAEVLNLIQRKLIVHDGGVMSLLRKASLFALIMSPACPIYQKN